MKDEKKIEDGGPAFPAIGSETFPSDPQGMSLRDWFAGQALVGLLSDPECGGGSEALARTSYSIADAMLSARNNKTQ